MNDVKEINERYTQIINDMAYGRGPGAQQISKKQLADMLVELFRKAESEDSQEKFDHKTMFSVTQVTREQTNKNPYPTFVLSGLKTNNGKSSVAKVSQVNGHLGPNYAQIVNSKRVEQGLEGDFQAKQSVYTKINKAVEMLDGQLYIYYRPLQTSVRFHPAYVIALDDTGKNFKVVTKEEVQKYKSPASSFTKQGLENNVEVRKLSMDSIAGISLLGHEYAISDLAPVRKSILDAANP